MKAELARDIASAESAGVFAWDVPCEEPSSPGVSMESASVEIMPLGKDDTSDLLTSAVAGKVKGAGRLATFFVLSAGNEVDGCCSSRSTDGRTEVSQPPAAVGRIFGYQSGLLWTVKHS